MRIHKEDNIMAVTPSTLKATIAIGQTRQDQVVRGPRNRSLIARFIAYWTAGPAALSDDPEPSVLARQHRLQHPFDVSYRR
jgi:hypothetical protein